MRTWGQPALGLPQHLARVLACRRGDVNPTQHARDFFDARIRFERGDGRGGRARARGFGDLVMVRRAGSNLRQVGDAQHLVALPQFPEQAPHDFGHRAAHAAIDFVKNQGRHARGLARDNRQRQG